MVQKKTLRMGVAGAGRMGQIHINNILETRFIAVTAVCSVIQAELDWATSTIPNVKTFTAFDDFIASDGFDAVLIVTPNHFHRDQVIASLRAGKHVFCEKPISPDTKSAWDVYYESLKFPELKVACGFPRRYAAPYVEAAKRIKNGDIGEVVALRSQTTDLIMDNDYFVNYIKTSGGIFVDCCIHDIDACLFLLGQDKTPATAYSTGTTKVFPMFKDYGDIDDGMGLVTFETGDVIMNVYGSRNNRHGHHSMTEVIGTKGRILINGQPRLINIDISDDSGTRMEGPETQMQVFGLAFKHEMEAFRDWILEGKEPNFNLKDAAKAVSIGAALMDSLHAKGIENVKLF
ncbi:hypothetical protein V1520DRAFT_300291 [Lipomyces starkeyi]|uniref:Gfo/Idh/MocA-like oxidoreductase N-terminal domain-containing protein n=1 Tax=Lipomyces starkeyi NRRL Y-11557 TaxID=675824 RepID=A0A1E3PVV6_LIPST|nr:hypothetical protein LIPSTDRAFT_88569 [Lipomyces starkeyi NRRL Y-11557]